MSYGGSAMLSMMIGLGIVMSCKIYHDLAVNFDLNKKGIVGSFNKTT